MTSFNDGIEAAAEEVRCGIAIVLSAMNRNGPERWAYAVDALKDALDAIEALKRPEPSEAVPADVRRLVVAARIVAFEDQSPEAIKELGAASEAFADRVPWDDEPGCGETEPSEAETKVCKHSGKPASKCSSHNLSCAYPHCMAAASGQGEPEADKVERLALWLFQHHQAQPYPITWDRAAEIGKERFRQQARAAIKAMEG